MTTAIYATRDGFDVLVIERSGLGGQAGYATEEQGLWHPQEALLPLGEERW